MNKTQKVSLAFMGGVDAVFNIFTPIALALILVKLFPDSSQFSNTVLISVGCISSLYKAIKVGFFK